MLWLGVLCGALLIILTALLIKIRLLQKAAGEICAQFAEKLKDETNTLITISGGDRHMRRLAAGINAQLRLLNRERHRYQRGDLELREAVTNISHDLRTPLTALCGYLDLLNEENKSEKAARYLQMIANRAEALKQLTEELFRYSVIASTAEEIAYETVALNSALEECVSAYYAALTARGITPEISMPEDKVLRRLDKGALARILSNIISNAIKYSDGDLSIVLKESGEMIFSNTARDLDGIAVGKLFDRFFTVETGRNATGLGLSIARLLTERMEGTLSADYRENKLAISLCF